MNKDGLMAKTGEPDIRKLLRRIIPSVNDELRNYPCRATLRDGAVIERLGIIESPHDLELEVSVRDLASLEESPFRIPAHLANKAYSAGETGMSYYAFALILDSGERLEYVIGAPLIDFPELPENVTKDNIVDLIPYRHSDRLPASYGTSEEYLAAGLARDTSESSVF